MNQFRFLILFFLMFVGFQQAQSQSYKFMTTGFSVLEKDAKGNWGKWSELQNSSIVVSLDTNKNRIVIYSQEVQLYDIVNYREKEENENDLVYSFECTDNNGMPFDISIITRKKQDNRKQLYVNQKDVIVVYNIVNFVDKNMN